MTTEILNTWPNKSSFYIEGIGHKLFCYRLAKMSKVTLMCHPEAEPKDLANEKELLPLRFTQGFGSLAQTPS